MSDYNAPIDEMVFVMEEVAGLGDLVQMERFGELSPELVAAVLEEAGKLAGGVVAPLNRQGDVEGARLENGVVRTPTGFREAYRQFVEGGWNGVPFPVEHGGQGLPWLVSTALSEMWASANLSFSLCPLLTQGAIDLLQAHGSEAQKEMFLPRMISGEWTGTMNLTEPQAGSDVGALRTRAERNGDHYLIRGQKIFITYGEHDLTENIIHMVLARTPDAPPGIRGISLFVVPKVLVESDGRLGARNDVRVASLEHKLGIHASPTCVMSYGDDTGAVGYLIGEEGRGIEYMFTMMNNARLGVGLEGVAIAERAYQQAVAFARERIQGRDALSGDEAPVPIIRHPDVRRMLLSIRADTEATRALAYYVAAAMDRARGAQSDVERQRWQQRVDLLIPVVKAFSTDVGVDAASTALQVHGGMGFIEETGAAQHYRDARIAPIYEGTNGIQALDLLGRKTLRDKGAALQALIAEIEVDASAGIGSGNPHIRTIHERLGEAATALARAGRSLIERRQGADVLAGATPFLRLVGLATTGWLLGRGAVAAARLLDEGGDKQALFEAKLQTARFYAEQRLVMAEPLSRVVADAGATVADFAEEYF